MIITVANQKGGVGKTTLAVHLAAWLHERGRSVILADCDAQMSSSQWIAEAVPELRTVRIDNPDSIIDELGALEQEADFVIADGPGSNSYSSQSLLMRSNLALVPCKASMLEVRALAAATKILRQIQEMREGFPRAAIVLSMVRSNYRLTADMRTAAEKLNLPLATSALTLRQAYADAPGQGKVVWKMGSEAAPAAREIDQLFREVLGDLVQTSRARKKAG